MTEEQAKHVRRERVAERGLFALRVSCVRTYINLYKQPNRHSSISVSKLAR